MALPRKFLNQDEELLAELRPHWIFFAGPLAAAIAVWAGIAALLIGVHVPDWTSYPLLVLGAVPSLWLIGRLIRWRTYTLALTSTRIVVRRGVLDRDTIQLRLQRITEINLAQTIWERLLGTGRLVIDVQGEDDSLILEFVRKPAIVQRVINSQINELVGGGDREPVPDDMLPFAQRPAGRHGTGPPSEDTPPFGTSPVEPAADWHSQPPPDTEPAPTPLRALPAPPPTATSGEQIRQRLIELDDQRRRGILTEEEFAAKKAELLNRI